MIIEYMFIAFGVYVLYLEGFEGNTYYIRKSEPIQGFEKDAKEEINMLLSSVFSFKDILQLHDWKYI